MYQPFFVRWFRPLPPVLPETPENEIEHDNAETQFCLGVQYANGKGAAQDYGQAAEWYLKAAAQNHALAEFNLGVMYANGQGFSRDDLAAQVWFGRSAGHGDAGAQHQLGMSRYRASIWGAPQGMAEARIEAYTWFRLAAGQGYSGSETARDAVALTMSCEDVAQGVQRAERFELANRENATA